MTRKQIARGMLLLAALQACRAADPSSGTGQDWPQYQFDAARQGRTQDSPAPPYTVAWLADFKPETLASQQPMVSDGLVYVATEEGNAYALEAETGERRWVASLGGPCASMAAIGDGLSFWTTLAGEVRALNKKTGELAWNRGLGIGIKASACLAEGAIFLGNRRGRFFRIAQSDGKIEWERQLSWHVFCSAAYEDGRVYVATEDMRVHCLNAATGAPLWSSEQFNGAMMRDRAPMIHRGRVFVTTLPQEYAGNGEMFPMPFDYFGLEPDKGGLSLEDQKMIRDGAGLPASFLTAQEEAIRNLTDNPHRQSFFALDAQTGEQMCVPPVEKLLCGWSMAMPPPAVDARGLLTVPLDMGSARFGFYDMEKNRIVDVIMPSEDDKPGVFPRSYWGTNTDEAHGVTVGGSRVFILHYSTSEGCDATVVFDTETRKAYNITSPWHCPKEKRIKASVLANEFREDEVSLWPLDMMSFVPSFGGAAISGDMFFKVDFSGNEFQTPVSGHGRAYILAAWRGGEEKEAGK